MLDELSVGNLFYAFYESLGTEAVGGIYEAGR